MTLVEEIREKALQVKQDFDDIKQAGIQEGYTEGLEGGKQIGREDYLKTYLGQSLTELNIPEGSTTFIEKYAFYNQKKIKSVDIPEGVIEIRASAFENATSLVLLQLPDTVTFIGHQCFRSCWNLGNQHSIILPKNLEILDTHAFSFCHQVHDLLIPASVKSIGSQAFEATPRSTITFEGTPQTVSAAAFKTCPQVTDIYCPWVEGEVANAPWGAINATIHYNFISNGYDITSMCENWHTFDSVNGTYEIINYQYIAQTDSYVITLGWNAPQLRIDCNGVDMSEWIVAGNNIFAETTAEPISEAGYYGLAKAIVYKKDGI